MLTKLTKEQEAEQGPWAEKWIEIALSTKPVDWDLAIEGIKEEYAIAKQAPPEHFVYSPSPFITASLGPVLEKTLKSRGLERAKKLAYELSDTFNMKAHVGNNIQQDVMLQGPGAKPSRKLGTKKERDALVKAVQSQWTNYVGGSFWAAWPAFTSFFRVVCGIKEIPDVREKTTKACGWWWPGKNHCVITDRPDIIKQDRWGNLHGETGPAMRWRDGSALYLWHGVTVPEAWIMSPQSIDPRTIVDIKNTEQRRVFGEIIGWERVLQELPHKILSSDSDENGQPRQLLELTTNDGIQRFVRVICGTGRSFILGVSDAVTTPAEAIAESYGLEVGEYTPEFRT